MQILLLIFDNRWMQSAYAGKLVKVPYRNWKDAKEDFRYHEKTKYHTQSLQKAGSFVARKSGATKSIDTTLNAAHETQVEKNRENLKPMIKTAISLGKKRPFISWPQRFWSSESGRNIQKE